MMLGSIYLVALIVGGILLLASLFSDVLGADDVSGHTDLGGLHILTLRGITYFAFVFGAVGTGLRLFAPGSPAWVTFGLALSTGIATGMLVDRVFRWIRRTEAGSMEGDRSLHGLIGDVIIPLSARREGKISVRRGNERLELLARPFDEAEGDPSDWKQVIIIDVRDGTALVSPGEPQF